MQTLRQKSLMAVLKTEDWRERSIPRALRLELETYQRIIDEEMWGFGFFDNQTDGHINFDINFENGSWNFSLNEDDLYSGIELATVTVKACTRIYMGNIWSDTFGLNWTFASVRGFWISDFELFLPQRKVVFYGDYLDTQNILRHFTTEYKFFIAGHVLISKTVDRSLQEDYSTVLMEREYESNTLLQS